MRSRSVLLPVSSSQLLLQVAVVQRTRLAQKTNRHLALLLLHKDLACNALETFALVVTAEANRWQLVVAEDLSLVVGLGASNSLKLVNPVRPITSVGAASQEAMLVLDHETLMETGANQITRTKTNRSRLASNSKVALSSLDIALVAL